MPEASGSAILTGKRISIVIPAYNEEEIIGQVIARLKPVVAPYNDCEILVIDDGSSDGTAVAAEAAGAAVIRHPYNKGNGAAVKTGIRNARGDIIVFMDGDGQHDPADIPRLLQHMDLYDMVIGARDRQSFSTWERRLANHAFNLLASYISGTRVPDLTSGFRVIRADLARKFCHLLPNGFSYPSTMTIVLLKAGYSVRFENIVVSKRVGTSKINVFNDGFRFLTIIFKIATLFEPLKIFLPIGLAVLLPGAVLALYRLFIGRPWTLPIVISVSVGMLIIVLGLISEQIALLRTVQFDR